MWKYPCCFVNKNSKILKLIERRKSRRRKPRFNTKRPNHNLRPFSENVSLNVPRSRGGITKALEKYTNMAKDASSNGDRIVAESYYQYAEHYQRLLNEDFKSAKPFEAKLDVNEQKAYDNHASEDRPSRTQRAINAKNERLNQSSGTNGGNLENKNDSAEDNKKKENFTSDGLEALKPFEI